ncbi:MAG: hypothetical protein FWF90_09040 [Promicromonosporaceae bacterium]|nr:hypothetical protein [Promicromonosporaceae bacterium]
MRRHIANAHVLSKRAVALVAAFVVVLVTAGLARGAAAEQYPSEPAAMGTLASAVTVLGIVVVLVAIAAGLAVSMWRPVRGD